MIPVSTLETWIPRIIVTAWRKIKRPRVCEPRAPVNLFEQVQPYASLNYVKEKFGAPYRSDNICITYRFKDVFVQITSKDALTISSVDVLLRKSRQFATFRVYPLQYVLGKIKLSDVLEKHTTIKKENSAKFFSFYVERYFGFPGKYFYYTFGLYSGPGVRAPKFEWDHKRNALSSDAKRILINWVGIGATDKRRFTPNFYHFI